MPFMIKHEINESSSDYSYDYAGDNLKHPPINVRSDGRVTLDTIHDFFPLQTVDDINHTSQVESSTPLGQQPPKNMLLSRAKILSTNPNDGVAANSPLSAKDKGDNADKEEETNEQHVYYNHTVSDHDMKTEPTVPKSFRESSQYTTETCSNDILLLSNDILEIVSSCQKGNMKAADLSINDPSTCTTFLELSKNQGEDTKNINDILFAHQMSQWNSLLHYQQLRRDLMLQQSNKSVNVAWHKQQQQHKNLQGDPKKQAKSIGCAKYLNGMGDNGINYLKTFNFEEQQNGQQTQTKYTLEHKSNIKKSYMPKKVPENTNTRPQSLPFSPSLSSKGTLDKLLRQQQQLRMIKEQQQQCSHSQRKRNSFTAKGNSNTKECIKGDTIPFNETNECTINQEKESSKRKEINSSQGLLTSLKCDYSVTKKRKNMDVIKSTDTATKAKGVIPTI